MTPATKELQHKTGVLYRLENEEVDGPIGPGRFLIFQDRWNRASYVELYQPLDGPAIADAVRDKWTLAYPDSMNPDLPELSPGELACLWVQLDYLDGFGIEKMDQVLLRGSKSVDGEVAAVHLQDDDGEERVYLREVNIRSGGYSLRHPARTAAVQWDSAEVEILGVVVGIHRILL